MHKTGAAHAPPARNGKACEKKRKDSQPPRKSLISNECTALHFLQAIHRKHGVSRACEANTGDINKVIHRNSGFLTNSQLNQALAGQTAQNVEHAPPPLAQKWGCSGA
jgi:hypothetical protein